MIIDKSNGTISNTYVRSCEEAHDATMKVSGCLYAKRNDMRDRFN